jgi:bacteriocin-like protein
MTKCVAMAIRRNSGSSGRSREMEQEQVFMTNATKTTAPGKQEPTSEELSEEELNQVTGGDAAPPPAKQPSGETKPAFEIKDWSFDL